MNVNKDEKMSSRHLSVLVLTFNEEVNIRRCLESVRWCNDVVVLDSFSTDNTVAIAQAAGARVFQRKFDNYSAQREFALREIAYKGTWVLSLDADERPDEILVREILAIENMLPDAVAFKIRRKDYFAGKWIRHSSLYPTWLLRLFKPDKIFFASRAVHEHPMASGRVGRLDGHIIHNSFSKGLTEWWGKHICYADLEARELNKVRGSPRDFLKNRNLLRDAAFRRQAMKEWTAGFFGRSLMRFIYMYIFRRGFLDGWAGYTYCRLLSFYEYMIVLNMYQARLNKQGKDI